MSSRTSDTNSSARFRWAECQLDTLGKCRNRVMIRKALAALPPTLDMTYDRILCSIAEEDVDYAIRVLLWLAFSDRPLTVDEVAEVIAIDVARNPAFDREDTLEDPLEALDICSSLVTLVTNCGNGGLESTRQVAVLAHYSVKEYLVSDRIQQGRAARYSMQAADCHSMIARGCLAYLSQFQKPEPITKDTLVEYKLARYSAEFWLSHAKKAGDRAAETSRVALLLLSKDNAAYLNWIRIHDPDRPWERSKFGRVLAETPNPLYYAALCGLNEVVRLLAEKGADVNSQGGRYGNPLEAASAEGHEVVVRLLLDKGADINAQGGYYGNALQAASHHGHEAVVRLLLDKGANINSQGGYYGNAFQAASHHGHEAVVRLLLDKGADINAQGGYYGNALQAASHHGHETVVRLLLDKGADSNAQGGYFGNALQASSSKGHEQVVKLLLDKGADVNAQSNNFTALSLATVNRNRFLMEILLAAGGSFHAALRIVEPLDAQSPDTGPGKFLKQTAICYAAGTANETMIKELIDAGADVNGSLEPDLKTPLHFAVESGRLNVVRALLAANADPTKEDELGRTASEYADKAVPQSEAEEIKREIKLYNKEFRLFLYYTIAGGKTEVKWVEITRRTMDHTLFSHILTSYKKARRNGWWQYSLKGFRGLRFVEVSHCYLLPKLSKEVI
jgi:ankyrin repeat protein